MNEIIPRQTSFLHRFSSNAKHQHPATDGDGVLLSSGLLGLVLLLLLVFAAVLLLALLSGCGGLMKLIFL